MGVAITSLLLVASSVYVFLTSNFDLSWILFLVSVFTPMFFPELFLNTPILGIVFQFLWRTYVSIIRVGVPKEKMELARLEFREEMLDSLNLSKEQKQKFKTRLQNLDNSSP